MKKILTLLFFLSLFSLCADEVRVEPIEYWQNASAWPDSLSVNQLIESSLRASGTDVGLMPDYTARFKEHIDNFHQNFLPEYEDFSNRVKGEAILEWMHREILTGRYQTDQTRMDVLLDRGDYNCVSSALVYLILTREAGLDTAGEETADHAFCTLRTFGIESVDVETTTLLGFDPGTKKEFTKNFSGQTGFAYVEPGDYKRRQHATDKKMVSLILQNRIALYQGQGEYTKSVGPAVDRWFFLPSEVNRKDMNDAFRNYVSLLNEQGRFEEALNFILPLSQEFDLLEDNRDLVGVLILNRIITFVNQNRLDEGEALLQEGKEWLSEKQIKEQFNIINERKAQNVVDHESYSDALNTIRQMKSDESLSSRRANELITWLHQNRALEILNEADPSKSDSLWTVIDFLDSLPAEEKTLKGIIDHRSKYLHNWAVQIHNQFADLVNNGYYDQADVLIKEALEKDSSESLIKQDRDYLEKVR
jgi:hypothetical protein